MVPEFRVLAPFLYRVSRIDNPFDPAPWKYRGHGRFDISGANLSVASSETAGVSYWSADPVTAFLEVLAAFRKWEFPKGLLELAANDPLPSDLIGGIVVKEWRDTHCLSRVAVGEEATGLSVVDLEAAITVAYFNTVSSLRNWLRIMASRMVSTGASYSVTKDPGRNHSRFMPTV